MRQAAFSLAVVALAACSPKDEAAKTQAAAPAAATVAGQPPTPRLGIWESTMTVPGPTPMKVTSQVCIDRKLIDQGEWMNRKQDGAPDCSQTHQASPNGYAFQSTCKMGASTVVSEGKATGDFHNSYVMEIVSRTDPPPEGVPAESRMTVNAHYVGPCAPGQPGGLVAGSMKMERAG